MAELLQAYFESDHLDDDRVRFVEVGGVRTRVWEHGHGSPLVLVHGGEFGDLYSLDSWSLNLTELAGDFRVCALDRLGQGFTDNPAADDGYTIGGLLEHLSAFVEAVAEQPVHLVGHSRGGFHAMRLALERPDLVRTLTIVDSNTAAPENPEMPSDRFYEALEREVPGPPTPDGVRIEPELQSFSSAHLTDDFVDRMRKIASLPKLRDAYLGKDPKRRARWEKGLNVLRQETVDRVSQSGIPVPVLVVWGREDPSAPVALGIDLFDLISERSDRAELHVINRAGHYAFREQPSIFNDVLTSFCLSG